MEIGPISGVRGIALLEVHRAPSEQPTVFEIASPSRADDETGSSGRQPPDRGLEDEDLASPDDDDTETAAGRSAVLGGTGISFFA